ncbi:RNA 3'-terminal phosphate cyclase [Histoplasma capsulatum H143]|uniref:RNA 3'-terminal phosphate cyclase n=1 Tax=Ajellomyces capsulatus (strain H143) TaxID=544712 RepID=C6HSQ2_AJECH|nr:RNA 3'-terminal phosphate cyclase [Histoplasma capsulatum H143]
MLHLDGSNLEGGGQLVRNALTLSALTGRPVTISNIRGKRKGPRGLRRSHTAAIQFLAEVCGARIVGATVGSSEITFYPRDTENALLNGGTGGDESPSVLQVRARLHRNPLTSPVQSEYNIRLTTPGSIFLIFQALYPYLMYAGARLHTQGEGVSVIPASRVIKLNITGGTNISFSPTYDYVSQVLIPTFAKLGLPSLSVKLNCRGWSTGTVQIGSVSFEIEPLAISSVRRVPAGQTESSCFLPVRYPRISLENLDPGYITRVDITVLAPDTTLRQTATLRHSKKTHHRSHKNRKHRQHFTSHPENQPFKRTTFSESEFDVEESKGLEPSSSGGRGLYDSPSLQSIRSFLEDATMKSVTRSLRVFSDNNAVATKQPSADETPVVRIHTTEPTYDPSHIYILLVAHTSTGFRLGRGQLYSEYQPKERNKESCFPNAEAHLETLLYGMVNECVAGLMEEFTTVTDEEPNDVPKKGTKGCLDTFMRDQVVVFQALGELDEEGKGCKSGNQTEEPGLSLHSLTAMWVCERILGVKM